MDTTQHLPTPSPRRRTRRVIGGAAAVALSLGALAACGDDDATNDDPLGTTGVDDGLTTDGFDDDLTTTDGVTTTDGADDGFDDDFDDDFDDGLGDDDELTTTDG